MSLDRATSNRNAVHKTFAEARSKMGGELQGTRERACEYHGEGMKGHHLAKHSGKMGKHHSGY